MQYVNMASETCLVTTYDLTQWKIIVSMTLRRKLCWMIILFDWKITSKCISKCYLQNGSYCVQATMWWKLSTLSSVSYIYPYHGAGLLLLGTYHNIYHKFYMLWKQHDGDIGIWLNFIQTFVPRPTWHKVYQEWSKMTWKFFFVCENI